MCRINLKKTIEPKRFPEQKPATLKLDFSELDQSNFGAAFEPKQPLFDESFLTFNSPLFTPNGLTLDPEAYPFPAMDASLPVTNNFPAAPFELEFAPQFQELENNPASPLPHQIEAPCYPSPPSSGSSPSEHYSAPVLRASSTTPAPECRGGSKQVKKRAIRNPMISEDKRERNRIAAEKYRKKGRELITCLEKRCQELSKENGNLVHRNRCLEDEINYLREILTKNGLIRPDGTSTFAY